MLRELPAEVPAATAHPALDKALNSTLNAVPPVPRFPLLLGFAVDQRMSSFISLTTALEMLIISFTFFKSSSYALVNIVTSEPNCRMFSVKASTCPANCGCSRAYCPASCRTCSSKRFDGPGQPPLIPRVLLGELAEFVRQSLF